MSVPCAALEGPRTLHDRSARSTLTISFIKGVGWAEGHDTGAAFAGLNSAAHQLSRPLNIYLTDTRQGSGQTRLLHQATSHERARESSVWSFESLVSNT